jgi:hypothetical protein
MLLHHIIIQIITIKNKILHCGGWGHLVSEHVLSIPLCFTPTPVCETFISSSLYIHVHILSLSFFHSHILDQTSLMCKLLVANITGELVFLLVLNPAH